MNDTEQQETPKLPTTSDPKEFIDKFKQSDFYKNAYTEFFKNKTPVDDVTSEEREQAFLEDDSAKFALVDFGTKELHFRYNPDSFPVDTQDAIQDYIGTAEDMIKLIREGATADEIRSIDQTRFSFHDKAALSMMQSGLVPTRKIGRAFARLILIDKGLDTPENAKKPDFERIQRRLSII